MKMLVNDYGLFLVKEATKKFFSYFLNEGLCSLLEYDVVIPW